MKKHLLTAALAIVAVGGVFAMNANKKLLPNPVFNPSTCIEITGCTSVSGKPACTLGTGSYVKNDCLTSTLAYQR